MRRTSRSAAASGWRWPSSPRTAGGSSHRSRRALAISSSGRSRTSIPRTTCSTCTPGLSRSGGGTAAPTDPGWRDTINLVPGERVEILIPFRDFAGQSVFHCHIAEHGDAGMMGIIEVRGAGQRARRGAVPRLRNGDLPLRVMAASSTSGRPASASGAISPRSRSSRISRARVSARARGQRLPARDADLGRRVRRETGRHRVAAVASSIQFSTAARRASSSLARATPGTRIR